MKRKPKTSVVLKPKKTHEDLKRILDTDHNLRLEYMDPEVLKSKANPLNWRKHPQRQRRAFTSLFSKTSWAGAVLYNETTGNLLDGHMRVEETVKRNSEPSKWQPMKVPVLIGNWDEATEKLILQNLDPLGAMAETDQQALASLIKSNESALKEVEDMDSKELEKLHQMNQDLADNLDKVTEPDNPLNPLPRSNRRRRLPPPSKSKSGQDEDREQTDESDPDLDTPDTGIYETVIKDDVLFPGDPVYGLPELLPSKLCTPSDIERLIYSPETFTRAKHQDNSQSLYYCHSTRPFFKGRMQDDGKPCQMFAGSILGFFTEDWRFEHCQMDPATYLKTLKIEDWSAIIEPDYSTYWDYPYPIRLWNVYRARWLCRFWQEAGFPIIPIIRRYKEHRDEALMLCTLPPETTVAAMDCHAVKKDDSAFWKTFEQSISRTLKRLKLKVLLVYGGDTNQKYIHGMIPKRVTTVYIPSFISQRRKK